MKTLRETSPRRRVVNVILLALLLGAAVSWGVWKYAPSKLTDSEAISIYIELRLAQLELGEESSNTISARDQILKAHRTSLHQFEKWLKAYRKRADDWDRLQIMMVERIDSLHRASSQTPHLTPKQLLSEQPQRRQ